MISLPVIITHQFKSSPIINTISSLANAGATRVNNRRMLIQRRILPKKRVLIRQRQQQQLRRSRDLRSRLSNISQRQMQIPIQQQARSVNQRRSLNRGNRNNNNRNLPRIQRVISNNTAGGNRQWQNATLRVNRPSLPRRGQSNGTRSNNARLSSLPPYQQYIEQARALIRAQEEMRNTPTPINVSRSRPNLTFARNIFVDVPVRNNGAGGDFRSGNRFVRGGRVVRRFRR